MKATLTGSALICTGCVVLSSCQISKQRLDYNWLSDTMLVAQEDQVNVEAGEGLQAPLPATAATAAPPAVAPVAPVATPQPAPATTPTPAPAAPQTAQPAPKKSPISQQQPKHQAAAPGNIGTYMVQKGDTLSVIARRHGVSLAAIVQANKLSNPDALRIGQVLTIPGKSAPAPRATARQNQPAAQQTAPAPTGKPQTPVIPAPTAAPQATAAPASAATHTYTVQSGDTLSRIARRYNTTILKIMQANGMTPEQANRLSIGQRILLPSH